jgi:hypothetical protein
MEPVRNMRGTSVQRRRLRCKIHALPVARSWAWLNLWNLLDMVSYALALGLWAAHVRCGSLPNAAWFSSALALQHVLLWSKLHYYARCALVKSFAYVLAQDVSYRTALVSVGPVTCAGRLGAASKRPFVVRFPAALLLRRLLPPSCPATCLQLPGSAPVLTPLEAPPFSLLYPPPSPLPRRVQGPHTPPRRLPRHGACLRVLAKAVSLWLCIVPCGQLVTTCRICQRRCAWCCRSCAASSRSWGSSCWASPSPSTASSGG